MDEVSVAGAEAAAEYFLQLYPYVYATGDLAEWRSLSHAGCQFCASVISNVEEQVALMHTTQGGAISIQSVEGVAVDSSYTSVTVEFRQAPSATLDRAGTLVEDFPDAKTYRTLVGVEIANGKPVIRGVQPEVISGTA